MSSKSQSRLGTRAKQIEEKKKKEHNQEHTRSNAQYQDHELRQGATRYAHAQAHSTDCKLRQSITLEGANCDDSLSLDREARRRSEDRGQKGHGE